MKISFNPIEGFISAGIGLFGVGMLLGMSLPVKAQNYATCFMETQTGQRIDLSSICWQKPVPPQSNSNQFRAQGISYNPARLNAVVSGNQFPPGQYLQSGRYNSVVRVGTVTPIGSSSGLTPLLNSYSQWKQLSDVSSLRSDPFGGSLVGQLHRGEPVRVYRDTRTDNTVYVETLSGRSGWIDIWALPDASGLLP